MPDLPPVGLKYDPYAFAYGSPPVLPAKKEPPPRVLAKTASHTLLLGQLSAYTRREVGGRSFLVAGPRGSGKTTLIRSICEQAGRSHRERARVIEVRLHGPSLFKPPTPDPTAETPNPKPLSVDEHVLRTLVINLYQTAAEEIVEAFRDHVREDGDEALELAAQLRLTLDGAPSAATLRFFWERAGAWPRGVLFPEMAITEQAYRGDQAAAEVVAMATASEAYRRCTGKLKREATDENSAGQKQESELKAAGGGKDLAQALMGLTAGVAAGSAAAAFGTKPAESALAGALTALASMFTFQFSRTSKREATVKEAVTFLPDTSASALVHRVLLLLRRLRQAGFVPVFMIDELDKVENLAVPLNRLASSLKFLFADEAFFCFLADRRYFLQLSQINREQTNAIEKTTFTHQTFVRYETSDLYEYLSDVIRPIGVIDPKSDVAMQLAADAEALRYILIQRSRMLMFELSRAIAEITGDDFWLTVRLKEPREDRANQFHLTIQLAIELVLIEPDVAHRIARDPDFAPVLYDALYYPTRHWYKDSSKRLRCTPEALVAGIEEMSGEPLELGPPDQKFLFAQVQRLLNLIANPETLVKELGAAAESGRLEIQAPVRDAIPLGIVLLQRVPESPDEYEWMYNRYGTDKRAGDRDSIYNDHTLWAGVDLLKRVAAAIGGAAARRETPSNALTALHATTPVFEVLTGIQL
jgi:hypothetical protein